jgi:hypothetical protein
MAELTPPADVIESGLAINQQQSPLLRLPGEIRNRIYEYVLSDAEVACRPHQMHHGFAVYRLHRFRDNVIARQEVNEMKYACRQLYHETWGLGLTWNPITFPNLPRELPSASGVCADFLSSCPTSHLARLRAVHIWEKGFSSDEFHGFHLGSVATIAMFCASHRHMEVTLHLTFFSRECDPFLAAITGCAIQKALSKTSPAQLVNPGNFFMQRVRTMVNVIVEDIMAPVWPGYGPDAPPLPPNFTAVAAGTPSLEIPDTWSRFRQLPRPKADWEQIFLTWARDGF